MHVERPPFELRTSWRAAVEMVNRSADFFHLHADGPHLASTSLTVSL